MITRRDFKDQAHDIDIESNSDVIGLDFNLVYRHWLATIKKNQRRIFGHHIFDVGELFDSVVPPLLLNLIQFHNEDYITEFTFQSLQHT